MRLLVLALAACAAAPRPHPVLVTTGERSHYTRTGRYAEAVALCHDFANAYAGVTCLEIGRTVEDRPIVALAIDRTPNLPVIYFQAGIHAGEIEGKDAGFAFVRDLLDGKVAPGALDRVAVVFVPVMNPDGHERFSPNNRPNQRGPEEMGFRTNAARQNLNRDFVKADAPETRAVLGVIAARDPVLSIDLHTTDGAKFQHDISISFAPVAPRPDGLERVAASVSKGVVDRLTALGNLPVDFYPSFEKEDDPQSGFSIGEAPPRFSQQYAAARDRLGVLVETHSWRTYAERVTSTYHALQAIFELATTSAGLWREAEVAAERADRKLAGTAIPMIWTTTGHAHPIAFRGYAYEKRTSEISGGTWIVYDETKPEVWTVPLLDELAPKISVDLPRAGYIVDGGFAPLVAAVLRAHGLPFEPIGGEVDALVFRVTKSSTAQFEGRTRVALDGAWTREHRTLDRGAILVPLDHAIRLVAHLMDPALPDSLAQWGFFNATLERKEYIEAYAIEEQARAMLARDPALRAQFDAALAADPALAKDPEKRLEWFYRRHPAWDERTNLLPVYKLDKR
jgi:hypothetical protein